MAIIKLTAAADHADEGSSYDLTWTFNFTPLTLYWDLTDVDGNVINSRSAIEVSSPSTSETIKISGDDLGITAAEKAAAGNKTYVVRCMTVYGTYSDGGTRYFRKECQFPVDILTVDHDGA